MKLSLPKRIRQGKRALVKIHSGEGQLSPSLPSTEEVIESSAKAVWRTAAASATGSSHLNRRAGCDDWFAVQEIGGNLIAVVADGMGSVLFGAVGARVATKAVLEVLSAGAGTTTKPRQLRDLMRTAVGEAQARIEATAAELSCQSRDLATTLACAVVKDSILAWGQVGDCGLVTYSPSGWRVRTRVEKSGYANETTALGLGSELLFVGVDDLEPVEALALFSDGLERIALIKQQPYCRFLDPLKTFVADGGEALDQKLEQLLESDRFRRATDDDATLIVAHRTSSRSTK